MTHKGGLTEQVLRQLYLEELITETEIASRHGVSQTQVGRLRRIYGIPTITKSDRFRLPGELSLRLRSILVGSMLGDGRLFCSGSNTAAYSEYHSEKQKSYLDWKVCEWGDFVTRYKKTRDDKYKGWTMTLHGCKALSPFWKLFYPKGSGDKTFVNLPLEWVDNMALAVWFMDDGSKSGEFFRFSVSPDKGNQQVQLRALRRLGIKGRIYNEGGDAIHVQDRTNKDRFLDLVRPHIHQSMTYKLEFTKPRKSGPAPRDLLTPERLQPLVDRGMPTGVVAEVFQVSRQSVQRAMDRMGVPRRRSGRPAKVSDLEFDIEISRLGIERLNPDSDSYQDDVLGILSRTEIPLSPFTDEEIQKDAERLRKAPTRLEEGNFTHVSWAGSRLCSHFFPHRWDARYRNNPSVRRAWYDPKYLRKAIQFQLSAGDPVTPVRVLRALQAVVRGPTNFRPSLAKAVVEAFCPEGGLVLDPCAGYGGRASGTLAAGRRYFGVDPHPQAEESHKGLHKLIGGDLRFENSPFEDACLERVNADLVFTSPPYFMVERYADDVSQSWVRYSTWEGWVNGFLRPMVERSRECLRPGGVFCVNTKNIRDGKRLYPIEGTLLEVAKQVGFELRVVLDLPLGRIGKHAQSEPLYVFDQSL